MTWLSDPAVLAPLATGAAAGLAAAVRALWLALVTAPKVECQAEKVILRQEIDQLEKQIAELSRELRDLYKSSFKLQAKYDAKFGKDSDPPTT